MATPVQPGMMVPAAPAIEKLGAIRRFSDSGLAAAIDKAVAAIPPGKTVAAIAFADKTGAGIAITVRIDDHWSVMGVTDYKYGGLLEAQAAVRFVI